MGDRQWGGRLPSGAYFVVVRLPKVYHGPFRGAHDRIFGVTGEVLCDQHFAVADRDADADVGEVGVDHVEVVTGARRERVVGGLCGVGQRVASQDAGHVLADSVPGPWVRAKWAGLCAKKPPSLIWVDESRAI